MSVRKYLATINRSDVGKVYLVSKPPDQRKHADYMSDLTDEVVITSRDIGKRSYLVDGVIQIESDEQLAHGIAAIDEDATLQSLADDMEARLAGTFTFDFPASADCDDLRNLYGDFIDNDDVLARAYDRLNAGIDKDRFASLICELGEPGEAYMADESQAVSNAGDATLHSFDGWQAERIVWNDRAMEHRNGEVTFGRPFKSDDESADK